ncbi:S-adenosyl-L-methionine-dependent methyltransferase [Naematelia encephala]|uniref:Leucine carboxyl methyltransferase 1 n=1 Tax=Naematelia encephala TaxID=71784 RepID=A0A1Y2B594_9TREE|nr:S-adenosyl-L-methionine-dependent methyltransferase [Naematelia encephala]
MTTILYLLLLLPYWIYSSAATAGYLADPFASILYKPSLGGQGHGSRRKPPLINVGTHHRTWAVDRVVQLFLDTCLQIGQGGQVVSLGAGSDTRFWRIMENGGDGLDRYIEVDFPHVTALKAQRIARSPRLSSLLNRPTTLPTPSSSSSSPSPSFCPPPPVPSSSPSSNSKSYTISHGGAALRSCSSLYTLLPLDLRTSTSTIRELLPHLDSTRPTLFLAECVFCYMPPEDSREIVRWFGTTFTRCVGVVYEMIGLKDVFGDVMRRNLKMRGLSLPGAVFDDAQSQANRFLDPALGEGVFAKAGGKTLWEIREGVIPPEELQRISKLEILDEIEELRLVLSHYCVAWGAKGEGLFDVML